MIVINVNYRQYLAGYINHLRLIFIILFTSSLLIESTLGQSSSSLSSSSSSSSTLSSKTCNQLEIRTDRLIKRLLLLNGDQDIPRTDKDILAYCKLTRKGFTLASKYSQCLPPFPRQILAIFMVGAGKAVRHVCDDPLNRAQVLYSLTCIDKNNIGRLYSLIGRSITILEYIGQNVTSDTLILPYGCCTYHFMYDRGVRLANSLCPDKSTVINQLVDTLINLTLSEVIEIGCSRLPDLSTCVKKIPQVMENIKSARSTASTQTLSDRSFIQPVLTLANRLIDDPKTVKFNDDNQQ